MDPSGPSFNQIMASQARVRNQLRQAWTSPGLGDELARAIRRLANRDGTSLNRAAVKLMRRTDALLECGTGQEFIERVRMA